MMYGVEFPVSLLVNFQVEANSAEEAIEKLMNQNKFESWRVVPCDIEGFLENEIPDSLDVWTFDSVNGEIRHYDDFRNTSNYEII